MKDISLLKLYIKFAKVGAMTFGGGYAMLPILERELAGEESDLTSAKGETSSTISTTDSCSSLAKDGASSTACTADTYASLISSEEILDYYAVAQSLPGLIAINVATIIGHKVKGTLGGIVSALGVISPCLVIITIIAALLDGFRDNAIVAHALSGISVCVVALIVASIIKLWKKGVTDIPQFLICLVALAISIFTNISPVFCIIGSGIIGIILRIIFRGNESAASSKTDAGEAHAPNQENDRRKDS